jgi:hypothetical protein
VANSHPPNLSSFNRKVGRGHFVFPHSPALTLILDRNLTLTLPGFMIKIMITSESKIGIEKAFRKRLALVLVSRQHFGRV